MKQGPEKRTAWINSPCFSMYYHPIVNRLKTNYKEQAIIFRGNNGGMPLFHLSTFWAYRLSSSVSMTDDKAAVLADCRLFFAVAHKAIPTALPMYAEYGWFSVRQLIQHEKEKLMMVISQEGACLKMPVKQKGLHVG